MAKSRNFGIYVLLAIAVFAAYAPVLHFDFVTYDDPDYVTANPRVQAGLSAAGIAWAFGAGYAGNWFPLTWLSHMLDVSLFGLDAGWHHFTNLWLHALSTLLWFAVLQRLTGARWRSALVAFLFGLHPLHVESVAWVAERKDVLSGLFWPLTLWAYAAYTARPGVWRYTATLALFCLGLMAKPMIVTLPLVLLLLDRWPLRRGTKLLEKLPFFAGSLAISILTFLVHRDIGAAATLTLIPLATRLENALISYCAYVLQMLWPANLAVFYPYPQGSLAIPAALAGIAIALVTAFTIRAFPRRPYLAAGWLWYVITLLPVIGLVQVGAQARADRYTYIPMIGLAIALVWGAAEALDRRPRIRMSAAIAVCAACLALTWQQVQYWRDSVALYRHAIAVTDENYVAHYNLAAVLETRGDLAEAAAELRETVRIRPRFAPAHSELGQVLGKLGLPGEALPALQQAKSLQPDLTDIDLRLGAVLGSLGRADQAADAFAEAVRLQPGNGDAHYNYGISLAQQGKLHDAAREFRATVQLRPSDVEARFNLGIAAASLGRTDEAVAQFREALRLRPQFPEAQQELGRLIQVK
uniref:TPR repeat-containing protein n=1 Tax=Solibacter usitatus (strain Ellin6076) TaxID=234267 RepID=Q01XC0_SOLUE